MVVIISLSLSLQYKWRLGKPAKEEFGGLSRTTHLIGLNLGEKTGLKLRVSFFFLEPRLNSPPGLNWVNRHSNLGGVMLPV